MGCYSSNPLVLFLKWNLVGIVSNSTRHASAVHLVSLYPYWINLAPRVSVRSIPGPQHQLTHEPGRTQLPLPSFLECVNYNPALPDLLLNNVNHKKTRKRKKTTTTTTTYKTNSKIQMNNNKIKDPENKPNQPKQSLSRQEGPPRTVLNSSDPPIHRQSGVVGQSAGLLGVRKHPFDCDKPWTFLPYSTLYALCLEALNKQWPWPITATTRKKQKTRTYNTHQKERKKENQKSKSKHTRHIQPELVGKSRSSSLPPILLRFSDSTKQRGGTICLGN